MVGKYRIFRAGTWGWLNSLRVGFAAESASALSHCSRRHEGLIDPFIR